MGVIYKPPGMNSEEFRRHLMEVHGLPAHRLPGCVGMPRTMFEPIGSGILQDGTPVIELYFAIGRRWKQVRRWLPQTSTCRLLPRSRAQLGLWPMRLRFWNNHQEVIHLVALHKVILLQQLVARLRCLTKYNIA